MPLAASLLSQSDADEHHSEGLKWRGHAAKQSYNCMVIHQVFATGSPVMNAYRYLDTLAAPGCIYAMKGIYALNVVRTTTT